MNGAAGYEQQAFGAANALDQIGGGISGGAQYAGFDLAGMQRLGPEHPSWKQHQMALTMGQQNTAAGLHLTPNWAFSPRLGAGLGAGLPGCVIPYDIPEKPRMDHEIKFICWMITLLCVASVVLTAIL